MDALIQAKLLGIINDLYVSTKQLGYVLAGIGFMIQAIFMFFVPSPSNIKNIIAIAFGTFLISVSLEMATWAGQVPAIL